MPFGETRVGAVEIGAAVESAERRSDGLPVKYADAEAALWTLWHTWAWVVSVKVNQDSEIRWLRENMPNAFPLTHSEDSWKIEADFYVDYHTDRIDELTRRRPGATVIRLIRPGHNQAVLNSFGAADWSEVMQILQWREENNWEALPWQTM